METTILQDDEGFEFFSLHDAGKWCSLVLWHGLVQEMGLVVEVDCSGDENCLAVS